MPIRLYDNGTTDYPRQQLIDDKIIKKRDWVGGKDAIHQLKHLCYQHRWGDKGEAFCAHINECQDACCQARLQEASKCR